eukprot:Skav207502  [mRNA]  locus=scaffold334:333932:334369:+ [translate_table: standard]
MAKWTTPALRPDLSAVAATHREAAPLPRSSLLSLQVEEPEENWERWAKRSYNWKVKGGRGVSEARRTGEPHFRTQSSERCPEGASTLKIVPERLQRQAWPCFPMQKVHGLAAALVGLAAYALIIDLQWHEFGLENDTFKSLVTRS